MTLFDWEQRKPNNFLTESKIIGHKGNQAKKLTVKLWGKGIQEKQNAYSGSNKTQYYIRKSGQLMYGKLDFLYAAFGIVPNKLNNYESTIDSPAFDVKNANSSFLLNLFLRKNFYLYYGERANGSRKARRIHEKDFLMMPIKIPSIQEQNKIVVLIKIINKLITLQQRKLEQLNLLKQAMSQQIFTNKKFPKIRFKNFTSIWKDYKFEDIFAEFSVKSKRENEYRILSSTNNGMEIRTGRVSGGSNIGYKIINDGDIVLSPQNLWLGNINLNDIGIGLVSPSYHTFKIININPLFIKPQLHSKQMLFKYKMASIQGASVVRRNLDMNAFSKITLKAPTNELEQGKIAIFCSYIEKIIGFQQKRINYLITLKKALLQNMFV